MLELTAPALLLAGFATSPHCALMCSPLQAMALRGSDRLPRGHALLLLHAGRVLGYGSLGALAGALGMQGLALLPEVGYGRALQILASAALVGSAVQLWRRPARCCRRSPGSVQGVGADWPRLRLLSQGVAWAAVPCGFVYSTLLFASLAGGPLHGFTLLAAFGLGTVPISSLGGGLIAKLKAAPEVALQRSISGLLMAIAMLSAGTALSHEVSGIAAWCLPG